MAIHSIILAWRMPWTEEPGGLQSIRLQRDRQDRSDLVHTGTHMQTVPEIQLSKSKVTERQCLNYIPALLLISHSILFPCELSHTSWQIDGETMETVSDFIFLGSKITADCDTPMKLKDACSLEEKL